MNALNGHDGKMSMMRVLSAFVICVTMGMWATKNIVCMCTGCGWVPLDGTAVALVIGALGAKAGQVYAERTAGIPRDKTE